MEKTLRNTILDCKIQNLPKIHNRAGNITPVESHNEVPFDINRVYYLYDIPAGAMRGGHAHKELSQFIVAVSGAFDVLIDDGLTRKIVRLDHPFTGLLIVPGIWREIINFSSGAICFVLASHKFDEEDYIRDYSTFRKLKNVFHSKI